jgi:hypothetical protein
MRASVGQGVAAHDAFATAGQRYDNVAATDPVGNAEGHISTLLTGHPIPTTTGTAWDLRMPDGSIGKATADHVVEDDWLHRKVANDPANDFAVVSGSGDSGLELASQDAQPGDPVAIVSAKEGVIHANALGHRPTQPDGHPNSFDALVVNKPVKGGTSGSPIVQLAEGPDKGKVVGVVSCGDETETAGAPASTMRQAIGGPVSDGQNSTIPSTTMPADMSHDTVQHGLSL